jgi:CAAX prenyl protease-like protein
MPDLTETQRKEAWIPHVVPFVAWIFLMQVLGDPAGWKYALRSVLCLGLFLSLKPWRFDYPPLRLKNLPLALAVGVFVFGFWILFETDFMARFEWIHRAYLTVGTQMPWKLAPPLEQVRYAPDQIGWPLSLVRLAGSALVISFIEEFFWRGWLYRWSQKEDFLSVPHERLDWSALLIMSLMFASVHHQWVAAFFCGICYGLLYIRTRDIWAAGIAHAVTNALLGAYVLWSGKYEFWA